MKATYIQAGEILDYKNVTDEIIEAGTAIPLISRIGVAGCNIPARNTGSVCVTGVFKMLKTKDTDIPMGTPVYFDGAGITSDSDDGASSNPTAYIPAGYAAADAAAGDAHIIVKLIG